MDEELKHLLTNFATSLTTRLEQVESRLGGRMDRLDDRMDRLEGRIGDVDGRIEQVETKLLTEFHKWASPTDVRLRSHTAALRALDVELESLSDRVKNLENGKGGQDSSDS